MSHRTAIHDNILLYLGHACPVAAARVVDTHTHTNTRMYKRVLEINFIRKMFVSIVYNNKVDFNSGLLNLRMGRASERKKNRNKIRSV